jgi:2-polyprenyl-3-methyl-5-hydroxy-6-metoxy-1,4-benzoquinol methylase
MSEFDVYAKNYDPGQSNPLKKLVGGGGAAPFHRHKADWLTRRRKIFGLDSPDFSYLDFGCGDASLLAEMANRFPTLKPSGCDESSRMLETARSKWRSSTPPKLYHLDNGTGTSNLEKNRFDLITAVNVFHHIRPHARSGVIALLRELTKPGGHIVVIEHNPANPATRWMVSRAVEDRNAVLLSSGETTRLLLAAGFRNPDVSPILFFPPRFRILSALEDSLSWLPFGAQYAVHARNHTSNR